ncbi:unnamed protein product [Urochloa humidicola]
MAEHAVFTVLQRVGETVVDEAKFLFDVPDKVESAKKELMRMQGFLKDLDDNVLKGGSSVSRNLVTEVREVAYEVEDIIDTANMLKRQTNFKTSIRGAISKYACCPIYFTRLHKLGARIDSANARIRTIFESFQRLKIAATAILEEPHGYMTMDGAIQNWRSVHPDSSEQARVIIGFDDQIEQMKDDLLDHGNRHLSVLSIVGPGGSGKSTMAKEVYSLPAVKGHFNVYAWVTVSQNFVTCDILKEIVKRLKIPGHHLKEMIKGTMGVDSVGKVVELEEMTEQELKKLLHDFALGERRYLIVLDDMWSTDAWDVIRAAFPDKNNGSRIILTTRNNDVAQHANARKETYRPKLLDRKESTRLLLITALPEYNLNDRSSSYAAGRQNLDELKKLGEDLAIKCRGLPLAIVVLGGYLSKNIDVVEWERLTSSIDWHAMISNEEVIGGVMDLSYYDMPGHLRSCFMYTTSFPEDFDIDVQVLARLWVAEGFIPLVRGQTREEIAMKYIAELVQRCMIQMENRATSGRITVIKVHDILRDWGIGRARREGLIKDCHTLEDIAAAYSNEMTETYRMVLHGSFMRGKFSSSMRRLRTLLDFTLTSAVQFHTLHHLRVLYLHSNVEVYLPQEIGRLRYLKYLGFAGYLYHLPSSIGELLSLETMHATARIDQIPCSLWKIPGLRHVHANNARGWSVPKISSQSKVHVAVFSTTNKVQDAWQMVERTKLQVSKNKNPNLSCCFGMTYNMSSGKDQIDIVGRCKEGTRFANDFLNFEEWRNIFVLKICCANLISNDHKIRELGRMSNLRALELGERSYTGLVMTFQSNSFPHLQLIVLHELGLENWKMEHGSMPNLWQLTLCKCPNLTCLPEGLSMLPYLAKVDLIGMPPGCCHGTVVRALREKGCVVAVSWDAINFEHLNVPQLVRYTEQPTD